MAVREYIGARYVPRFLGTYSGTTIYEALDVVDDGMGTSYIARKTVPAGTPLTDTDYWFVYGASSGAIINLQNRVTTLENDTIPELDEKIENKFYNGLHGVNILFLADSFGMSGWGDWCDYVKSKMGTNYNIAIDATSGATLSTFATKLASVADGTYDDILMVCGTNDIYTDLTEVVQHYTDFKTAITGKYKQTRLHFAFVATRYGNAAQRALIKPCHMLYEKMCGEMGIRYLGNLNKYLFPAFHFIMPDGIHPNTLGGKRLASAIGKAFCDCCEIFNDSLTYHCADYNIDYDLTFDITENGTAMLNLKYVPTGATINPDGSYHNITIPVGNYQGLTSLNDAAFKFTDCRHNGAFIWYEIDNANLRLCNIGSTSFQVYNFAFASLSKVDLDVAVNA